MYSKHAFILSPPCLKADTKQAEPESMSVDTGEQVTMTAHDNDQIDVQSKGDEQNTESSAGEY